jgi:hypothetical protein
MRTLEISAADDFRDTVVAFSKRLTEYIVHVLDFYYFYSGNVDQFLSLMVRSWASIPSVYDDVGHYIMRCLLTVSMREMDPDTGTNVVEPQRFENSLRVFRRAIDRLPKGGNCGHIVSQMQAFLADDQNREYLRCEFSRAVSLIWTTVMYFYCRPLRMYFELGDHFPGGLLDERALCPEFEFGEVQERLPVSPVAFLWKYLSGEYTQPDEGGDISIEGASIWLFSWLASCGEREGGRNAS